MNDLEKMFNPRRCPICDGEVRDEPGGTAVGCMICGWWEDESDPTEQHPKPYEGPPEEDIKY